MKVLTNLVESVSKSIDTLSLSSNEKKQIRAQIVETLYRYASELQREQAAVVRTETEGNWLQRSWRPMVMLTFTFIVLLGAFVPIPMLEDSSRFWELLEIGMGGYLIGRSVEKVTDKLKKV